MILRKKRNYCESSSFVFYDVKNRLLEACTTFYVSCGMSVATEAPVGPLRQHLIPTALSRPASKPKMREGHKDQSRARARDLVN